MLLLRFFLFARTHISLPLPQDGVTDTVTVVVFFMSLDRTFNEDSKKVLKTVILSLQVGITGDFVLDCRIVLLADQTFLHDFTCFCSVFYVIR